MSPPLKILTLNVKGMASPQRRQNVFRFLRDHPAHVVCLQEVNAPDDSDFWTHVWGAPASWNKYTAILLSPSLGSPTFDVLHEGRVLLSTFRFHGQVFKLANFYAPSQRPERRTFFNRLSSQSPLFSTYDFLVGDWNSYPDPDRDRRSSIPPSPNPTWPRLLPVLTSFTDAALAGSSTIYHTYHFVPQNLPSIHSRIDHVFMNVRHTTYTPSTSILVFAPSDHDGILVTFSAPSYTKPPLWRLNTSLLSSSDLRESTIARIKPYHSPIYWDASKIILRSHAQDFAVVSARRRQSQCGQLERQLATAHRRAAGNVRDAKANAEVLSLRQQLDDCLSVETSRATLRARVRWLEEGETCSAYFFSRFRSRSNSSTLSMLRFPDGSPFLSDACRHAHIKDYFTTLCAAPSFSPNDCSSFLDSLTLPALSAAQNACLSVPITSDELLSTIKALPPRRAPGPDGIPYEWYQTFAEPLLPVLLPLFNSILSGGPAPPSWSSTLVSLIPKPDRDLSNIANWRPITLANCDVKIFSRILATRLATVLPQLISPHQAGFVRGRQAADVAMALRQVLGYAAEQDHSDHPVDGALIFLDQEKAYDRISHPYLTAVLTKFGFSSLVQHALSVTYTNTSALFMDDNHPIGPVSVACGVRQGDPLAPLLFNLAFEPLLVALRSRLQGFRLPWGVFVTGAFADDLSITITLSDGTVLIATLDEYCRASNSRINFQKSVYMPLSGSVSAAPRWAASLGLRFHDPRTPIRVLGFDLVLSPDGVQEDWDALYTKLESTSTSILSRHLTLQGRTLLVTSKLFSRLWYKFSLSSPPHEMLTRFSNLGWKTVWNGHPALAPSVAIGRRPRLQGGVNFLYPAAQAQALLARWISKFFSGPSLWSEAFQHALDQVPGGLPLLTAHLDPRIIRRFPLRWQQILTAWSKLNPHWNPDLAVWTPSLALSFPIPKTSSDSHLHGISLAMVLEPNQVTQRPQLITETVARARFRGAAPGRIVKALDAIRDNPSSLISQLVQSLCSLPLPLPPPSRTSSVFNNLLAADTPVRQLTTAQARRFLDKADKVPLALDWSARSISRLAVPPKDIWSRIWRAPITSRHKETMYKLIMNTLPLGTRIFHFAPESLLCHACSTEQTLRHFIYSCPLAQQVWSDFGQYFRLDCPVTLFQALFSWPAGGSRYLGREYGHRLQAGHAVAVHTLWLAHCQAVYDGVSSSRSAVSARFRYFLQQHFTTLSSSRLASRIGTSPSLPPFF